MNIIGPNDYKKLIHDPSRYSVFYTNIDVESPTTKQACKNLNLDVSECNLKQFSEF